MSNIPEIDIWRSALLMVHEYGEDAASEADTWACNMIDKGDHASGAAWRRISQAIEQLQQMSYRPLH